MLCKFRLLRVGLLGELLRVILGEVKTICGITGVTKDLSEDFEFELGDFFKDLWLVGVPNELLSEHPAGVSSTTRFEGSDLFADLLLTFIGLCGEMISFGRHIAGERFDSGLIFTGLGGVRGPLEDRNCLIEIRVPPVVSDINPFGDFFAEDPPTSGVDDSLILGLPVDFKSAIGVLNM